MAKQRSFSIGERQTIERSDKYMSEKTLLSLIDSDKLSKEVKLHFISVIIDANDISKKISDIKNELRLLEDDVKKISD